MATKTKALVPAARPDGLKVVSEYPNEPPVGIPLKTDTDAQILTWTEELRDHFEKEEGKLLSVKGLLQMASVAGLDPDQTKALRVAIKRIYAAELGDTPTNGKPKAAAKPAKTEKPAAPAKPDKKAAVVAAKPSKNGKAEKPVKDKPAKPAKAKKVAVESELAYDKTVKGIAIKIFKTETGLLRVSFDGFTLRGCLRYLGAMTTWTPLEVEETIVKLLSGTGKILEITQGGKKVKGPEAYVHEIVGGGHVGAGRKAGIPKNGKKSKKSCFGYTPDVGTALLKKFKALRA